ncbi:hypothetical protein A0J61_04655 [Choanephora cucurbitarum]|uniref:C2H2-type domain-containing protein n=1 Tax=Choanephora cucurbitarum TaxID=101091 RepID=A0A1C7NFH2_9FUNG|nr:hypothetical protein A0J61_04655 [Choanephora cucurbitarum]
MGDPNEVQSTVSNEYCLRSQSQSVFNSPEKSNNPTPLTDESDDSTPKIIVPQGEISFHCQTCDLFFMDQAQLSSHNGAFHKKKKTANNAPDPNNPSNYCCICDYVYKNRASFHSHLRNIHSMRGFTANKRTRPGCNASQQANHRWQHANTYRTQNQQLNGIVPMMLSFAALAFIAFVFVRRTSK